MKSDKYCITFIKAINLLKQFTTIQSSHYSHGRKCDCNKRSKNFFYFYFHSPKDVDENLKLETEFIRKSNESLPENRIEN